jgi:hypothetical protein
VEGNLSDPLNEISETIQNRAALIKGSAKDQTSYRMIPSVESEALIKQAADYFRLGEAELAGKRGRHRQEPALVLELLHRYSGLKSA